MIIVKIINHRIIQVALAPSGQQCSSSTILALKHHKQLGQFARTLVQSTAQSQKVTVTNNQQLIPVARNISFRQCQLVDIKHAGSNSTEASFSLASGGGPAVSHFLGANLESDIVIGEQEAAQDERPDSPLDVLKRRAKHAREKRELANKSKYYGQIFNEAEPATTSERRLVVLLSWLEAKEKHIEKYREFYLNRGFDVLNVKTAPLDLLLPNHGARKISEDFVRFMIEKQYSNVVLHGFSVGGYMFGRFLLEIDRLDEEMRQQLLTSIRGLIFDSLVPFEGTCVGVANSLTRNPLTAKIFEQIIRFYLLAGHNIATKYFLEASEKVWGAPLSCPTLFFMSKDDKVTDYRVVERLAEVWTKHGVECQSMVVDSSPHVQLFINHHQQYAERVDGFLKRISV